MTYQQAMRSRESFYLRYYCGHKGKFGHEFLEFELRPDRLLRYANNSHYKNDVLIRKEVYVTPLFVDTIRERVRESNILDEDDALWPNPNRLGKQELELVLDGQHISFDCAKTLSLKDCTESQDPVGMQTFYYLIQDLRCIVFSLIGMHFKIKPI